MPSGSILLRTIFAFAVAFLAFRYHVNFRSAQNALPFKAVNLPNRGKGLIATRDIMQGEVILKETPLFVVKAGGFKDLGSHIHSIVSGLNSTSRSTFFELSYPSSLHGSDIPIGIFQTNSVKMGDDAAGIFPLTARINHGCSKAFNSVYSWKGEVLVVHALKHIRRGEEILREYINTKQSRRKRRSELYEIYAFDCSCSVCSLSSGDVGRSDTRLSSIITIHAEFLKWKENNLDAKEAVRLAKQVWALGEKEGYWRGRGQLGEDVVNIAAAHQEFAFLKKRYVTLITHQGSSAKATQQWAELALEWYSYELGYDSREADRMRVLASDPSKHPAWGTRGELLVGGPDMILM